MFPIANYFVVFSVQSNSFRCPLGDNFSASSVSFCSGWMRERLNNCTVNICFRNYKCYFCISCLVDLLQFSDFRGGSPRSKHHNLHRLWSLNGSLDHHRYSILECRVSDTLLRQFIGSVRTWCSGEFFYFSYKVPSLKQLIVEKGFFIYSDTDALSHMHWHCDCKSQGNVVVAN